MMGKHEINIFLLCAQTRTDMYRLLNLHYVEDRKRYEHINLKFVFCNDISSANRVKGTIQIRLTR